MRLIDADKLDVGSVFDENGERCGYRYVDQHALDNAPTVDAIPVSFIRNYCPEGMIFHNAIEHLIDDWIHRDEYKNRTGDWWEDVDGSAKDV